MTRKQNDGANISVDDKIALVEKIFIMYPRLRKLLDSIEHSRTHSKIAAEPECMFIGGLPGTGKTTCQFYHIEQFRPAKLKHGAMSHPILRARVPNKATDKTLVTSLLRNIGDIAYEKGSTTSQTYRLEYYVAEKMVELCHVDEFQHFVDKDNGKVQKNVSSWLKNLIDETRKPFILWGMPYADKILDVQGNEQLRRRIWTRGRLDPFGWDTQASRTEFRTLLKAIEKKLPFIEPSELHKYTMAFRFYCATNGRVGYVMNIVRRAAEIAIRNQMRSLTLSTLAEAYNERMMPQYPNRNNPFSAAEKDLVITPFEELVPELAGSRMVVKGHSERASDVLRK
jgi:hypothetical protein